MKLGNQKAKQLLEVGCKTNCAHSKGIRDGRTGSVTRREKKRVFFFFFFADGLYVILGSTFDL
jgi:hypothetical protein